MLEFLLYTTLTCSQSEALVLRIEKHLNLDPEVQLELVETVKESAPECYWDAHD